MNEELNKLGMDIAKEIAPNVYNDLVKKPFRETSNVFELLPRSIRALCLPLEKWILNREFAIKELSIKLSKKLEKIKDEDIVPPDAYIAVPLIQQYSYCIDKDELKNLYANLLASSMNRQEKNGVHPGFVDIIKQLSPDEAKILKKLNQVGREAIVSIVANNEKGESIITYKDYSLIGYKAQCDNPQNTNVYIDNLCRLGLILNGTGIRWLTKEELYNEIYKLDCVAEIIDSIKGRKDEFNTPDYEKGYIELTSFGKSFCNVCIS